MSAPNEIQPVRSGPKGLAGSYAPRRKTGRLFRSLGMAFDFVERLPTLQLDHSRPGDCTENRDRVASAFGHGHRDHRDTRVQNGSNKRAFPGVLTPKYTLKVCH
jgi:hypothetical protein